MIGVLLHPENDLIRERRASYCTIYHLITDRCLHLIISDKSHNCIIPNVGGSAPLHRTLTSLSSRQPALLCGEFKYI